MPKNSSTFWDAWSPKGPKLAPEGNKGSIQRRRRVGRTQLLQAVALLTSASEVCREACLEPFLELRRIRVLLERPPLVAPTSDRLPSSQSGSSCTMGKLP
ncbi:unnamed protein product [Discosporangium mesarthrocarpum]